MNMNKNMKFVLILTFILGFFSIKLNAQLKSEDLVDGIAAASYTHLAG